MTQRVRELREANLSAPVSEWLLSQGYTPYAEVLFPTCGRMIDLVGRRDRSLVVVELKCSLTRSVIHQAFVADLITDQRYAAVGTRPSTKGIAKCERIGIGLLSVIEGVVNVLLLPRSSPIRSGVTKELTGGVDSFRRHYQDHVHHTLDVMTPNGIGGRPTLKDEGPAQDCFDRLLEWRRVNPAANWKQVFASVPNHYSSPASMRSAMCVVEERRRKRE